MILVSEKSDKVKLTGERANVYISIFIKHEDV